MRNPNGYGTVYKLSGKRRKPFCVRKVIEYDLNGKAHYEYLGYFEKRQEALNFLAQYNMSPREKNEKLNFSQVYYKWYEKYEMSENVSKRYEKAYERSNTLYDKYLKDISQSELQAIIDQQDTRGAKQDLKNLFSLMWQYAERNEISCDNRTLFLEIPSAEKSSMHVKFTNKEMKTLWENKSDTDVQVVLALIYTGCRPMELFKLTENDFHETYFDINEGKNKNAIRSVPLHESIREFIPNIILLGIDNHSSYNVWAKVQFKRTMERYGMEHTPYDCRHTFASLWADNSLNEMYRRFIQGHSRQGIGEEVYTHIGVEKLCEEVNKLPINF